MAGTGPDHGLTRPDPDDARAGQDRRGRCGFCGKYRHQVSGMAVLAAEVEGKPPAVATVCTECLELCGEIIAEELT